jgi:SpoVK/Ycf46/Vps4 family AAA+-type ATPase
MPQLGAVVCAALTAAARTMRPKGVKEVGAVAGSGEHIKALVRSHASGDDKSFYSVAMQVAAQAARQGHHKLASDLKQVVDSSRGNEIPRNVTKLAQPRGDLSDLVTASYPEVGLRDLVLPQDLMSHVGRVLAEQRQRKVLLDHGYSPAHRLLLEGPPGTGKTMTASVLAHELSIPLLTIRLESLLSKFMGETAGKLRVVFDAIADQRGVYLFDEFDALGGDRAGNDVGEARRILSSFLVFLEQASPESVVVAATNHRSILDRALFRRFDMVLTYELPNPVQAAAVMRARLGSMGKGVRWSTVTSHAEGLSHADLVQAAESAAKAALLDRREKVTAPELAAALAARRLGSVG